MAPKTRATFAKRQKEQARQEKQRAKAQRKLERKLEGRATADGAEQESSLPESETPNDTDMLPSE